MTIHTERMHKIRFKESQWKKLDGALTWAKAIRRKERAEIIALIQGCRASCFLERVDCAIYRAYNPSVMKKFFNRPSNILKFFKVKK